MSLCRRCQRETHSGFTLNDTWICSDHVDEIESIAHLTYQKDGANRHIYSVTRSELRSLLDDPLVSDVVVLRLEWISAPSRKWRPLKRSDAYQRSQVRWFEEE